MLRFISLIIPVCIGVQPLNANPIQHIRFKDLVFPTVEVAKNIAYNPAPADTIKAKYYLLDLYQPENDTGISRPLIIWIHGGGFKFGKKSSRGIPLWSKQFAQRGYVCAAVNYRLSRRPTLSNRDALLMACFDAVNDVAEVIDFFKKNHATYKIDTTRIILGGNSAGGMVSLQSVYGNENLINAESNRINTPSHILYNPNHIAAIINFWGGIFDSTWLKNANIPFVSVLGSKDRLVPPDNPDKGICGGIIIHRYGDSLHIHNSLKIYYGYAHELQKRFNPLWAGRATRKRWAEAGDFAADFLFRALLLN